ncbi:hypothetical protein R6V09_00670 [Streptomyces sp. W16]|uniref:hypothetical protein n=1 Tax=Streptomyces sp. W16 TaxID=3076631 RepID=UPI00295A88EE|nr:hypothetical protein [Streptomyces sp. W16]MDV9168656.1 hypothetical protein [Streptomyces sp. W16]
MAEINGMVPGAFHSSEYKLRYWSAADAIRRTIEWVGEAVAGEPKWHEDIGDRLTIHLDDGERFNAWYNRTGVYFFHGTANNQTIYSAESPDIVCHEMGHAVLDLLNPRLFGVSDPQVYAFHEAFGDISSMFSSLTMDGFCSAVIFDTGGDLKKSSRLSRMAEQMAWALRRSRPSKVEQACIRDVANEFYYADPMTLPLRAPAVQLCAEEHSFSRVFSAAVLDALAETFCEHTVERLQDAAKEIARILVVAASATPMSSRYYADVAAHMLAADRAMFGGEHGVELRAAFVDRGILSLSESSELTPAMLDAGTEKIERVIGAEYIEWPDLPTTSMPGARYGLTEDFLVVAPSEPPRFVNPVPPNDVNQDRTLRAATFFVDSLFSQGEIRAPEELITEKAPMYRQVDTHTHEIVQGEPGLYELRRVGFDDSKEGKGHT